MSGNIDIITINTAEYKSLVAKAAKYDQLRRNAEKVSYLTEFERAVYEIPEPKPAKDESEDKANEVV